MVKRQSLSVLRLRGRRRILARFGHKAFDQTIIQALLGFTKVQDRIIDRINPLVVEYDYSSAIGQCLFFGGAFEQGEIDFFAKPIAQDSAPVILDVGANIGSHSLRWAQTNQKAKIYAFEPSPGTREILTRNVNRNCLQQNIVIVPMAASSKSGVAPFFECEDNAFSSLKDTKRKRVLAQSEVQLTTIDEFVRKHEINKLSLIKIDVEGLETEVLAGAENTLRSLEPDLFVEIYGGSDSNPNPDFTINSLCALGYKAFVLVNGKPLPFKEHIDSLYNYYFTTRDLELS